MEAPVVNNLTKYCNNKLAGATFKDSYGVYLLDPGSSMNFRELGTDFTLY